MAELYYRLNKLALPTFIQSRNPTGIEQRNKQVYLGKLDAKTEEIILSKRWRGIVKRAVSAA